MKTLSRSLIAAALAAIAAAPVMAQEFPVEGPVPTTALVGVTSKKDVPLDPAQLKLTVNGHESPITAVMPVTPAAAQVAILIDDGLRGSFDLQLTDITKFINALPQGTKVLVGYMQNGGVHTTMPAFSADHAAVADSLRVALSAPGVSASPYFSLSTFVKQWPSTERGPRFVLMVTNGVDPYNGRPSVMNQDSPYVEESQKDAERAGVAVYSIYYGDRGIRGPGANFSGQSYLQQVAEATGGELLTGGITPVSFAPFLKEFNKRIAETYTVQFMANATNEKQNALTAIKLKTTQDGVKLHVPEAVHPGLVE